MKTNIEFYSKKFFTSKNKRNIACEVKGRIKLKNLMHFDFILKKEKYHTYITKIDDEWYFTFKGSGVAKYNILDENLEYKKFNYETGRKIALTRAQQNLFNKVSEFYSNIVNELNKYTNYYKELQNNSFNAREMCKEHTLKIIKNR